MSTILREIDVDIVRINLRGSARGSPQYVFAVHPLNTRAQRSSNNSRESAIASTFIGSTLHPIDENEIPIVHEVARTYSQCRTLYKNLKKLTNGAKNSACRCSCEDNDDNQGSEGPNQQPQQSSCPCRALFSLLDAFMFPRKRLLHRRSRGVFQERRFALSLFIKSVLQKLQSFHDHEFEQVMQQQQPQHPDLLWEDGNPTPQVIFVRCKAIAALLRFLALEDATLVSKIREVSQRLFGKLNLEGWHSDRKNLYFINEDCEENNNNSASDDGSKRGNTVSNSSHISNSRSSSVIEECESMIVGPSMDLEEKRYNLER